jgi:hypothetical protein
MGSTRTDVLGGAGDGWMVGVAPLAEPLRCR